MTRYLRHLRIAFSITCGIACVLLVVLWVDSYWSCRSLDTRYYRLQIMIATLCGVVGLDVDTNQTSSGPGTKPHVYAAFATFPATNRNFGLVTDNLRVWSVLGGRWVSTTNYYEADVPFWFFVVFASALGTLPWIGWSRRFSLRTLLIAMTLIGLILGTVIATTR